MNAMRVVFIFVDATMEDLNKNIRITTMNENELLTTKLLCYTIIPNGSL